MKGLVDPIEARCAVHPSQGAFCPCARCGRFCCAHCLAKTPDETTCLQCVRRLNPTSPLRWEIARGLDLPAAFWSTTYSVLVSPGTSLAWLRHRGALSRASAFGVLCVCVPVLVDLAIGLSRGATQVVPGRLLAIGALLTWAGVAIFALLIMPTFQWLILRSLGTPTATFSAQLRLAGYCLAPFFAVGWVPYVGWVLAFIYATALLILGQMRAQQASGAESVVAAFAVPALAGLAALYWRLDRFLLV